METKKRCATDPISTGSCRHRPFPPLVPSFPAFLGQFGGSGAMPGASSARPVSQPCDSPRSAQRATNETPRPQPFVGLPEKTNLSLLACPFSRVTLPRNCFVRFVPCVSGTTVSDQMTPRPGEAGNRTRSQNRRFHCDANGRLSCPLGPGSNSRPRRGPDPTRPPRIRRRPSISRHRIFGWPPELGSPPAQNRDYAV
jgi:hypothetical protein